MLRLETPTPEIPTPTALVDLDTLDRNIERMAARAKTLGVRLRPHVKTHKSIDIARLQMQQHSQSTNNGITVSTIAEAFAFADAGFRDITWAFPIPLCRVVQAASLSARLDRFNVVVDHPDAVIALEECARSLESSFDVFLKIDCGNHRAGVDPRSEHAIQLAMRIASSPYLRFRGVLAHGGHAYACTVREQVERVAEQERDEAVGFAERLRSAGVMVETVSVGSTPTMSVVASLRGVTEIRPGNYVLYDVFQATLGMCSFDDIALSVLATVVGVYPDRNTVVVDAGALALSLDPGPVRIDRDCGFGVVQVSGSSRLFRVRSLSQEHGVIGVEDRPDVFRIGLRVRILPNHACMTAAMFS